MGKGDRRKQQYHPHNQDDTHHSNHHGNEKFFQKTINARLLATQEEKSATSKSLYFDHDYRISTHPPFLDDKRLLDQYDRLFERKLKGKRVLFIGASLGLGILPMMAIRNGATRVVAVDDSAVVPFCQQLAKENGFTDDRITFVRGNMLKGNDEMSLPADCGLGSFDVIYCDWVSTLVMNNIPRIAECLCARDRYLKPGGELLPRCGKLHAFGVTDYECYQNTQEWWSNVYGLKMETMRACVLSEPFPGNVWPESQKTDDVETFTLNLLKLPMVWDSKYDMEESGTKNVLASDPGFMENIEKILNPGDIPFKLTAEEKSSLHYITVHASCEYDDHFRLGCGPMDTHSTLFSQSSLGLPTCIPIMPNDTIRCCLRLTPDSRSVPPRIGLELAVDTTGATLLQTTFQHRYIHAEYR